VPAKLLRRTTPSGWVLLQSRFMVTVASFLIELLAAIPSIAYGLWGVAVLIPFMQEHLQPVLARTLGPSDRCRICASRYERELPVVHVE